MEENKQLKELSIFFPFWNEEKNIERVVKSAETIAPTIAQKWEILMIDDGSRDKTREKAKKLARYKKNIKLISHSPNRGYGAALKEGFAHAQYRYVVFADGDGQFDFSEITKFVEKISDYDMVVGYRKKRNDQDIGKRLLLMRLLKIWDFIFFRFLIKDIDCGFKMFRKSAIEAIYPLRSEGAMISTEIFAKAKNKNLRICEVGVEHFPRKYGAQTGANFGVVMRAIIETFIIWWDIKFGRY